MGKKDRIKELEARVAYLEAALGIQPDEAFNDFEEMINHLSDNPEDYDNMFRMPAGGYFLRRQPPSVKKQTCGHSKKDWVESVPVGAGYRKACVNEQYEAAGTCPHCGIKYGFAPGTGDCGCQTDYDVGF